MTSAVYLEHYLDSLESLPIELQRNFSLMRDLDNRAQSLMKEIDSHAEDYLKVVSQTSPEKRKEQMERIQKLFNKAKEYGDDKVQLAIQTYELVDKHIRRLDSDLARFETEIKEKSSVATLSAEEDTPPAVKKDKKKMVEKVEKKKKGNKANISTACEAPVKESSSSFGLSTIGHSADVLDMPVDPNEPTYCLCHQVSYGEMIGCDNPDCPIEWFHFACVSLTTKPKGKWFCPKCSADRKKK
ncbi:hypothetical protein DAPPUDRAFT_308315 [Daphnia pulex]|uniref:Inhibitor of growth protein n=1 Tax=Daphnia pulex TaxID=6669 RepID=E9H799_DAPPU|nr:hypothetical protein DAPPUDRAFT_308315 [Daphnia pulex]|eukprot:EFX72404.1 hypothetical protein DAPPUDRAFT_308315 [Daphnia pulex]